MLSQLCSVDSIVVIVYLLVVFGIGMAVSRRKTSEVDYFLAGRKLPWYAISISLFATNISTNHFVGFCGLGYSQGLAMASFEWLTLIGILGLTFIFLPYYERTRVITLPEFLELRYDQRARALLAGGALLLSVFMELASMMYTGALALETVLGIKFMVALILIGVFVGIYTAYGGLAAVVWTDVFQGVVLYAGGAVVTVLGLAKVGGLKALMEAEPASFHTILPANHEVFPWPGIFLTGLPLLALWYWCSNQVLVQRTLAARSDWDARMGTICVQFIKLIGPFVMVLPGIIAFRLYPDLEKADTAYPTLVRDVAPSGISGIVLAGLVAALMSSADSVLNSCSTLFTHDFYLRYINPRASQRRLVLVGRIATVAILAITLCWAPVLRKQESIVLYSIDIMGFLAAPFVAVFLAGLFTKRATPTAVVVAVLTSLPVSLAVRLSCPTMSHLYRIPLVFVFSVVVIAVVSAFTKPRPAEDIEGLTWNWKDVTRVDTGLLASARDHAAGETVTTDRLPLYKDYRVTALIATVLTVVMFYIFR